MQTLLHITSLLLLVLVLGGQVDGEVDLACPRPECEKCEVLVEQEKTDLVVVDWSQAWWDLDLACLNTLTLTLDGESDLQLLSLRPDGPGLLMLIYSLSLSTLHSPVTLWFLLPYNIYC